MKTRVLLVAMVLLIGAVIGSMPTAMAAFPGGVTTYEYLGITGLSTDFISFYLGSPAIPVNQIYFSGARMIVTPYGEIEGVQVGFRPGTTLTTSQESRLTTLLSAIGYGVFYQKFVQP